MKGAPLKIGFIPLVDAAPLIIARELGFAEEEGIDLELKRSASWSALRDLLYVGQVDAAHMLAPVPVAGALGLGGAGVPLSVISVLSINGNVIGLGQELAYELRNKGHNFSFLNAKEAGKALIGSINDEFRIGVPFPFSMHAELIYYWLSEMGLPAPLGVSVRTIPPSVMVDALKAGEIDAFCVGEPWGSLSVENNVGTLLLPTCAIWKSAPEKVLATRTSWAESEPVLRDRLIRAVWRAARWLSDPSAHSLATEVLSRNEYLNVPAELIGRALSGNLVISAKGEERKIPGFVRFYEGAATFPWKSQAEWIGDRLASRNGLDRAKGREAAARTFRSDFYRAALGGTSAVLPGASSKLEGALSQPAVVSAAQGQLELEADSFFDGQIFEPSRT